MVSLGLYVFFKLKLVDGTVFMRSHWVETSVAPIELKPFFSVEINASLLGNPMLLAQALLARVISRVVALLRILLSVNCTGTGGGPP